MKPPTRYAIALFEGFQVLDAFGPLDVLFILSKHTPLELSVLGPTTDPVSSRAKSHPGSIGQAVVPTHTYDTAPSDIEVLIVPGGAGTRDIEATQPVVDPIKRTFPELRYLLTVCTGSALAARAGVLDEKNATSNKLFFDRVRYKSDLETQFLHSACAKLTLLSLGGEPRSKRQLDTSRALGHGWKPLDLFWHISRHRHDICLC